MVTTMQVMTIDKTAAACFAPRCTVSDSGVEFSWIHSISASASLNSSRASA